MGISSFSIRASADNLSRSAWETCTKLREDFDGSMGVVDIGGVVGTEGVARTEGGVDIESLVGMGGSFDAGSTVCVGGMVEAEGVVNAGGVANTGGGDVAIREDGRRVDDNPGTNGGDTGGVACDSISPGVVVGGKMGEEGATGEPGRPGERVHSVANSVLGLGYSAGGDN